MPRHFMKCRISVDAYDIYNHKKDTTAADTTQPKICILMIYVAIIY